MNYKFINIPNHELISEKICHHILNKTDVIKDSVMWNWINHFQLLNDIPEIAQLFKQLTLEVERIAIINAPPKIIGNIHIDYDKVPRFLWPIRNCRGSFTNFYDFDTDNIINHTGPKGDKSFHIRDVEKARYVESLELIAPVVFKPWVAHNVVTNPEYTTSRLSMTIKFKNSKLDILNIE